MPAVPFYGSLRAPLTSGVSRREGGMRDAQRARAGPARLAGLRTAGPWAGLPWEKACLRPAVRGGSPGEGGAFLPPALRCPRAFSRSSENPGFLQRWSGGACAQISSGVLPAREHF